MVMMKRKTARAADGDSTALHSIRVLSVRRVTAHLVRIKFESDTLLQQVTVNPGVWMRVWFPGPATGVAGASTEYQRGYTLLDAEPQEGTFFLEFVLHEPAGPASAWAARAQVGDVLSAHTPGEHCFELAAPAERVLLVGDSASIPAFNQIIASLDDSLMVELCLEQHHPDDRDIPLCPHPNLSVRWVVRDSARSLTRALRKDSLRGVQVWAAVERDSAKHLRRAARLSTWTDADRTLLQGYWVQGSPMGIERPVES